MGSWLDLVAIHLPTHAQNTGRKSTTVANAMGSLGLHEQTVGSARQLRQEVRIPSPNE